MKTGRLLNISTDNHVRTPRNYSERGGAEKIKNAELAKKFDIDYWDGSRNTGYGGYKNDGRWIKTAKKLIETYGLTAKSRVLDVGCGKGFLLSELKKQIPELEVCGIDISTYALSHASPDVIDFLSQGEADKIDFPAQSFDLVLSINCLHNLELPELFVALQKIQLISKKDSYICVESYRNESEKWNLLQWQLTCECFFTPKEWLWIFKMAGYNGDFEFIFFE